MQKQEEGISRREVLRHEWADRYWGAEMLTTWRHMVTNADDVIRHSLDAASVFIRSPTAWIGLWEKQFNPPQHQWFIRLFVLGLTVLVMTVCILHVWIRLALCLHYSGTLYQETLWIFTHLISVFDGWTASPLRLVKITLCFMQLWLIPTLMAFVS